MSIIESVTAKENVTQVNVYNMPSDSCFFSEVFKLLKQNMVNIDMICRPVTHLTTSTLSFSCDDKDFNTVIAVLNMLKRDYKQIKFSFCTSNCKIVVKGEKMRDTFGIASDVFGVICSEGIDILLICTSETEISLLVSGHNGDKALSALTKRFL
ncbi:MAG: hypothetical protein IJF54_01955 [Clostridia bacterium]|nr:hypothetical protein [Clostridia bacterium]